MKLKKKNNNNNLTVKLSLLALVTSILLEHIHMCSLSLCVSLRQRYVICVYLIYQGVCECY